MTRYTSRADLLIAAGESIKMQDKAGIEPVYKHCGSVYKFEGAMIQLNLSFQQSKIEFPLAVVEGKPVFVGDELYSPLGMRFIVDENGMPWCPNTCSWNPPKPATVMVELPVSVAQRWANPEHFSWLSATDMQEACRKALEKA